MSENDLKNAADKLNDELEIERVNFSSGEGDALTEELSVASKSVTDAAGDAADGAQIIPEDVSEVSEAFNETAGGPVISDDMVDSSRFFRTAGGGSEQEETAKYEELEDKPEKISSNKRKGKKNVGKEILSWILTFVIAFLVAIIINAYFFRISKVSGGSMLQTFHDGQTVFISRAPYIFSEPKYGDVVVFDHDQVHRNIFVEIKESVQYNIITMSITKKNFSHKYWIKRVIGVPGDTIEIKLDGVYRNGVKLTEDYVNPAEVPNYSRNIGVWKVGEGELFVMGDNRNHSSDSRAIGLITINSVLGKVLGQ